MTQYFKNVLLQFQKETQKGKNFIAILIYLYAWQTEVK